MEDDQQFCLRWNNHQSTLIQNFDTLLESGTLVDCTLAAEGKYLKAHKVVLSACSPYFEGLLSEHYDKHPVFILKDVKFKELKAMMDYMYRGEVNISQDQLTALLKAAESLQIKGLSDSRTGGGAAGGSATSSSKTETRSAKAASSTAATSSSLDIPHASSGLTIEKNSKVPRQSLQQVSVSDLPEDSASPQLRGLSSREGSQSPTSRKRLRKRKRSVNNDDTNSMENHEASNSSDVNISAPALGVAPVATEEKSHADPAETIGRSALMQQLTKPADEMLQIPIEKPEPSEEMIQPKSEYLDDQDDVEDLTNLDDDMNDLNEMEQDNSRAGPSHDPSQHGGIASWHISGDRSNASVVGAAAGPPGQQDEVFLAAHEAAQAQRDSQGRTRAKRARKAKDISFEEVSIKEAPIVHLDDIECNSEFEAAVMMRLQQLSYTVDSIKKGQDDIAEKITSLKVVQDVTSYSILDTKKPIKMSSTNFETKYQIMLPMLTYETFQMFEEKLKGNQIFREDVYQELQSLLDKDLVISKSMVRMLKKFLTKDLAKQFTAIRSSSMNKNKYKFKPTEFCKTIDAVITNVRNEKSLPTEPEDLNSSLTDVLSNVGKWKE